jgi:hypothetical protein
MGLLENLRVMALRKTTGVYTELISIDSELVQTYILANLELVLCL